MCCVHESCWLNQARLQIHISYERTISRPTSYTFSIIHAPLFRSNSRFHSKISARIRTSAIYGTHRWDDLARLDSIACISCTIHIRVVLALFALVRRHAKCEDWNAGAKYQFDRPVAADVCVCLPATARVLCGASDHYVINKLYYMSNTYSNIWRVQIIRQANALEWWRFGCDCVAPCVFVCALSGYVAGHSATTTTTTTTHNWVILFYGPLRVHTLPNAGMILRPLETQQRKSAGHNVAAMDQKMRREVRRFVRLVCGEFNNQRLRSMAARLPGFYVP